MTFKGGKPSKVVEIENVDKRTAIYAQIPDHLYLSIKEMALKQRKSLTDVIIECFHDYKDKYKNIQI